MCPSFVPGEHHSVAKVFGFSKKRSLGDKRQNILIAGHAAGQGDMGALIFDRRDHGFGALCHEANLIGAHGKVALRQGNHVVARKLGDDKGGTMRLGAYSATLREGSKVAQIYGKTAIEERHRHRYEVDAQYIGALEKCGLIFSGMSPDGRLPEIVEVKDHPWFIGVQFHPELKSKPFAPHPLFADFVRAAKEVERLV
jgi:hypothetical protein